jgi:hypothetical protein
MVHGIQSSTKQTQFFRLFGALLVVFGALTAFRSPPVESEEVEDDNVCGVSCVVDLSLEKFVLAAPKEIHGIAEFELRVWNARQDGATVDANGHPVTPCPWCVPAHEVTIEERIPAGLTYVSHTAAPGTIYNATTRLWTVGFIPLRGSSWLKIRLRVDDYGPRENCTEVGAVREGQRDGDSSPGNAPGFAPPGVTAVYEDDDACARVTICTSTTTTSSVSATTTSSVSSSSSSYTAVTPGGAKPGAFPGLESPSR